MYNKYKMKKMFFQFKVFDKLRN